MAKTLRVQHAYKHKSGLAVDDVVNTFYFHSGIATGVTSDNLDALEETVMDFYDAVATGQTAALRSCIPETSMSTIRHAIKIYDMGDPEPRVPIRITNSQHGVTNNSVSGMPAEVATCVSYRGDIVSGTNAAKRRGRLFIGPLAPACGEVVANGHWRPTEDWRNNLVCAARGIRVQAAADGWEWVVHGGTVGDFPFFTPITHVWADDAFDTQRRRGPKPTTRTSLDLA